MSKAKENVRKLNAMRDGTDTVDAPIARASKLIVGYDDDTNLGVGNSTALNNNSMLVRYSTDYPDNAEVKNAIQAQRYIASDLGARGASFKAYTILGATDSTVATPVEGEYAAEWVVNVEMDNYSTQDIGEVSCGLSSTVRRYSGQGVIGLHVNAMDMRVPQTATDASFGGLTGIEAHSDGIGPDHRTSNGNGYGYRQTIRCTARTQRTIPDWVKRGTAPFGNGATVAVDDICLPKDAVLTEKYVGTYFVCTTGGVLGGTDTVLDAATIPLTEVTDGTAVWSCRVGTEVGVGIKVMNGSDNTEDDGAGAEAPGYYRYGIIVSNNADNGNLNEIAHAIYVKNNGTENFLSEGDPDWHVKCKGSTVFAQIGIGAGITSGTVGKLVLFGHNDNEAQQTYATIASTIIDSTVGSEDARLQLSATTAGVGETHVYLEGLNTIIGEKALLSLAATNGFLHISSCNGAPIGVPDLYTGKCPLVVDIANGRLYIYHSGAWHYATLT